MVVPDFWLDDRPDFLSQLPPSLAVLSITSLATPDSLDLTLQHLAHLPASVSDLDLPSSEAPLLNPRSSRLRTPIANHQISNSNVQKVYVQVLCREKPPISCD